MENIAVLADHIVNLNKSEKKDKFVDLAREIKRLWNRKITVMPIITRAINKESWELGNKRSSGDQRNASI